MVDIRPADPAHIARLAEVLGGSFVTEPMMAWPLGGQSDDLSERSVQAYAAYLAPLVDAGLVWETVDGHGALVLVPPDQTDVWDAALAQVDQLTAHVAVDDERQRHERLWAWVASRIPPEPAWHLDSVGVEPGWQGHGIGSALIAFAIAQTVNSDAAMILETGSPRNVPLYMRHGFRIVDEADSPEGGPHVWFMRRDP